MLSDLIIMSGFWAGHVSGPCNHFWSSVLFFSDVAVHFGENCSYMDEYFSEDER